MSFVTGTASVRRLRAPIAVLVAVLSGPSLWASDSSLADALKAHDTTRFDALLSAKADVRAAQPDGTTALHWAVQLQDLTRAERLLKAGADANAANRYRETPISLAAANANAGLVRLLLEAGARAGSTSGEGEPVLMTAARGGSVESVKLLVAKGADVNATEPWYGQTALMWAAASDHVEVVKQLLAAGAGVEVAAKGGFTALMYAARNGAHASGALLVGAGADVNHHLTEGYSALTLAIHNASYELAATLVEAGADVNDTKSGFTPVYHLIWSHYPGRANYAPGPENKNQMGRVDWMTLMRLLLARGADPSIAMTKTHPNGYRLGQIGDSRGFTPLMLAARFQDVELMRLLLANGADPKAVTYNNTTLLSVAAGVSAYMGEMPAFKPGSYMETLQLAFEVCACDVNEQNGHGWTALHAAVAREANDGLRFLASKGARFDLKTAEEDVNFPRKGDGKTPMRLAMGNFQSMSYKWYCDQQVVLRELMNLPPAACIQVPPGGSEPALTQKY